MTKCNKIAKEMLLTLFLVPMLVGMSNAKAMAGASQVAFNAGNVCGNGSSSCYAHQLDIKGINQYGLSKTLTLGWFQSPVRAIRSDNWWWKPEKGITLSFYLSGYGLRSCTVSAKESPFSWMHVTYTGGGNCRVDGFNNNRWQYP